MTSLDQAKAVRQGESLDAGKIAAYLKEKLPGLDRPGNQCASFTAVFQI